MLHIFTGLHRVNALCPSGPDCFVSTSVAPFRSIFLPLLVDACTSVRLNKIQLANGGTGPGTCTLTAGAHVSSTIHAAFRPHHFWCSSGPMVSCPSILYRVERLSMALRTSMSERLHFGRLAVCATYITAFFSDTTVTLTATESSFPTFDI